MDTARNRFYRDLSDFIRNPVTGVVTTSSKVDGIVKTQDMYGIGGGIIWDYNFGNKSELRLSGGLTKYMLKPA